MTNKTIRKLVVSESWRTWIAIVILGSVGAASTVAGLVAMPRKGDMWVAIVLGVICLGLTAFTLQHQLALGARGERIEALMANPKDIVWIYQSGMVSGWSRLYSVIVCSRQGEWLSLTTGNAALRDQYLAELQAVAAHTFLPYTTERWRSFRKNPASLADHGRAC